uniref:Uncharacterized protein n=1 Tax=Anguilla anguilla TaxID=7936 RepID=A0A0E9TNQ2_ANGAN
MQMEEAKVPLNMSASAYTSTVKLQLPMRACRTKADMPLYQGGTLLIFRANALLSAAGRVAMEVLFQFYCGRGEGIHQVWQLLL